jgi:hypothetical protein
MLHLISPAHLLLALAAHAASQKANSPSVATWLGNPACGVLVLATFASIIIPAVWARNAERRDAAFRVLDRILRALTGR